MLKWNRRNLTFKCNATTTPFYDTSSENIRPSVEDNATSSLCRNLVYSYWVRDAPPKLEIKQEDAGYAVISSTPRAHK